MSTSECFVCGCPEPPYANDVDVSPCEVCSPLHITYWRSRCSVVASDIRPEHTAARVDNALDSATRAYNRGVAAQTPSELQKLRLEICESAGKRWAAPLAAGDSESYDRALADGAKHEAERRGWGWPITQVTAFPVGSETARASVEFEPEYDANGEPIEGSEHGS